MNPPLPENEEKLPLPPDSPAQTRRPMAAETRWLLAALVRMEPEDIITYAQFAEIAGCNVQYGRGVGYLYTARKRALQDYGIVVEAIYNEGLRRVSPQRLSEMGQRSLERIRNLSRRTIKKMATANLAEMTDEQKTHHLALLSGLAMIAHAAEPRQIARLEPLVRDQSLELPVGRTLEALR